MTLRFLLESTRRMKERSALTGLGLSSMLELALSRYQRRITATILSIAVRFKERDRSNFRPFLALVDIL
jgi:hypothetical protein